VVAASAIRQSTAWSGLAEGQARGGKDDQRHYDDVEQNRSNTGFPVSRDP
jgi:hypothetical protein